jgi:hypothetical protein
MGEAAMRLKSADETWIGHHQQAIPSTGPPAKMSPASFLIGPHLLDD